MKEPRYKRRYVLYNSTYEISGKDNFIETAELAYFYLQLAMAGGRNRNKL